MSKKIKTYYSGLYESSDNPHLKLRQSLLKRRKQKQAELKPKKPSSKLVLDVVINAAQQNTFNYTFKLESLSFNQSMTELVKVS